MFRMIGMMHRMNSGMLLGRFLMMFGGVQRVPFGQLGVMCGQLIVAVLMRLVRFPVMQGCCLEMLGGLLVMIVRGHSGLSPIARGGHQPAASCGLPGG